MAQKHPLCYCGASSTTISTVFLAVWPVEMLVLLLDASVFEREKYVKNEPSTSTVFCLFVVSSSVDAVGIVSESDEEHRSHLG